MRVALGFVAYNGVLAAVGMALLYAAGLVSLRPVRLAGALGAALVCGLALAASLGSAALTAGLTLHALPDTIVLLVLGAVFLAVGRRRRASAEDPDALQTSRVGLGLAAIVALYILVEAALSRHTAPAWDSAHNWYLKAVALGGHIGLDGTMIFTSPVFTSAHQTYPLAHPVIGGLLFQYIGNDDAGRLISQLWLLLGATVLAAPFLAGGGRRGWLALLPFAVVAVSATSQGILRGDADMTMACFLGVGALALGRWVDDGPPGLLAPAVVCLAAAANTKNEGLAFVLALLVVAGLVVLVRARRRLLPLIAGSVVTGVLVVPWLLWVHVHGPFGTDVTSIGTSLHPSFLDAHSPMLDYAAQQLIAQITNQASYAWVFPLALVLCIALVATGPRRGAAAFFLGGVVLALFSLLWVYWTYTGPDPGGHVVRTLPRTISGPLFVCAAALAYLLPRLVVMPRLAAADERVAPLPS